jgi:hypothetical protein
MRGLPGRSSPSVSCAAVPEKSDREMPDRTPARHWFDALALSFARRSAPRSSDPQSPEISGTLADPPNARTRALEPNVGTLLYLVSLAVVATATVVVFFGLGLFLLTYPSAKPIAGPDARERGVEIEARPSDLAPSPNKNAAPFTADTEVSHPATGSAPTVPPAQAPDAHEVLPSRDPSEGSLPASTAGSVAANATFDASSSQELPGLRPNSDEATLATPTGAIHAKRVGIGRQHRDGARKHWAGISPPGARGRPPPSISGPEKAWRWIVRSATSVLAALSPPPLR